MAKVEWPVIGIDLGTTFSCVAVWHNGRVEIIHNDVGKRTTPSVVAFTEYEYLIGNAADSQAKLNPQNTVFDSKRLIGRRFNDVNVQEDIKLWPFKVISGTDVNTEDKPMINVNYMGEEHNFAPEEISAMILAKMKSFAEDFLHCTVKNAVITVPAYFNDLQRRATKEAGAIAGLNVVAIINEPTAAALAYGLDTEIAYRNNDKKNVVVIDLGGGTFDVSYVTIDQREVKVKAVNGDTHLGGRNFENNMVVALLEEFKKKHQNDISENQKALRKLRVESNAAKEFLSSAGHTSIDIDCLYEGIDFSSKWSRSRFENLNKHLFQNCISIVEKCLEDAKMEKSDVDDIVLIGGSTRIPKFRELLQAFFEGKELCKSINPDEAVAYGAAVHAAVLGGVCSSKQSIVLTDVTPLCLSLKNLDDSVTCVIPKFTAIPVTKHRIRVTARDNQTTVTFEVYEGDKDMAEENNFLDEFRILDIPPAPKGQTKFDVCFEIDRNGILNVSAVELSTGLRKEITVMNYNKHLSKEEIKRMVDKAKMLKTLSDMAKALKME